LWNEELPGKTREPPEDLGRIDALSATQRRGADCGV
jgi:hypothetical protein